MVFLVLNLFCGMGHRVDAVILLSVFSSRIYCFNFFPGIIIFLYWRDFGLLRLKSDFADVLRFLFLINDCFGEYLTAINGDLYGENNGALPGDFIILLCL